MLLLLVLFDVNYFAVTIDVVVIVVFVIFFVV